MTEQNKDLLEKNDLFLLHSHYEYKIDKSLEAQEIQMSLLPDVPYEPDDRRELPSVSAFLLFQNHHRF